MIRDPFNRTSIINSFIKMDVDQERKEQAPRRGRRRSRWPGAWQVGAAKRARDGFTAANPQGSEMSVSMFGPTWAEANVGQRIWRKALRYKGPGDYFTEGLKYGLRGAGALAYGGRQLYQKKGWAAAARAAKRGYKAGGRVSKAIGYGDYMTTNQITSNSDLPSQQNVHHMSTASGDMSGDIVYSNTEFIKNVYATVSSGTSPFNVETFSLNPALSETFPFLSQIAQNFELFEFQGLLFQYKPTSGEFGSNNSNALGKVVLATNYDPDAVPFTNSIVMENYDYACSTKPSSGCIHGVECDPDKRATQQMYTRTGESTKDKVFTDLGVFQIASEGIPSSVAQTVLIGELWVTYTVKLSRAKLYQSIGESIAQCFLASRTSTAAYGNKVWEASPGSSIGLAADPDGQTITYEGLTSTTARLRFSDYYQGKRIMILPNSNGPVAAGFIYSVGIIVNCTVVRTNSAEDPGVSSVSQIIVQFNDNFTGEASVVISTGAAPAIAQNDYLGITVIDKDLSLVPFF